MTEAGAGVERSSTSAADGGAWRCVQWEWREWTILLERREDVT